MSAIAATPDVDWRPWIIGLGLLLAVPIGKSWQLADRGDGRGDMAETSQDTPITEPAWFIDCTGGDNANDGRSGSQPKLTTGAISPTTGEDTWLKEASICEDQLLAVGQSGTAGNYARVGCYKIEGGQDYECNL